MKTTLLLCLLNVISYAQVGPHKIKVTAKKYHSCDSLRNEIISARYPYVQTPSRELNRLINDTVRAIIGIDPKIIPNDCRNGDGRMAEAAETDFTFQVNSIRPGSISLNIYKNSYAGGWRKRIIAYLLSAYFRPENRQDY